jgi:flagellar assembly protein FliH
LSTKSIIWGPDRGGDIATYVYPTSSIGYHALELEGMLEEPDAELDTEDIELVQEQQLPAPAVDELRAEYEQRLAEETRRAFEAGRQQGQQAEREVLAAELQRMQAERRQQAEQLLAGFVAERDRYLAHVETEVVRLALQVAARILRREAQMDPLLLTGAVRVALGQLAASTMVRLHVPAQDHALWQEAIAHLPKLQVRPEVVSDSSLHLGECKMETGLGSVDLGIGAQLAEIERGFFDRVPAGRGSSAEIAEPELVL